MLCYMTDDLTSNILGKAPFFLGIQSKTTFDARLPKHSFLHAAPLTFSTRRIWSCRVKRIVSWCRLLVSCDGSIVARLVCHLCCSPVWNSWECPWVALCSFLHFAAFLGLRAIWARALYGTPEFPLGWPFWSLLRFALVIAVVDVLGTDPSVISFMGVLGFVSRFRDQFCYLLKLCNFVALVMKFGLYRCGKQSGKKNSFQ